MKNFLVICLKKIGRHLIFKISVGFFVLVILSLVLVNSKFLIKRDFNLAFQYRTTGDCDAFLVYINQDAQKWKEKCEEEKSNIAEPIRNFEIQQVSHKFLSSKAFLQVELKRNFLKKDNYVYSVNYEVKRDGFKWKIDQEVK